MDTRFYMVVRKICGVSVWKLTHVTPLAH
jgi:hypothetical protein